MIGDLFEIQKVRGINTDKLAEGIDYDYVTRTSYNQGVLQTTGKVKGQTINEAGTWSLGLLQMDFFYRKKEWYAGQFVRKIVPKIKLNEKMILFFTTIFNSLKKVLLSVLVRDVDNKFLNMKIELPVKNGEIDYDFMSEFISELEEERISELKKYLKVTGLDNYALNSEEEKALEIFDKIKWKEFRIGELFEKINPKRPKYKVSELSETKTEKYNIPVLTAGLMNQGLNNFAPDGDYTKLKNKISISANGANTGATFYQTNEFAVLQDAYAIDLIEEKNYTKEQMLFYTSAISKAIYGRYEWTFKAGWTRVEKEYIKLPVDSKGNIDYEYMNILISAIQKEVIKGVVDYANENIDATKKL